MVERWVARLAWFLAALSVVSLFLMMTQTVVDVLASNLARQPIPGNLVIVSVYHMVLVVFLPLAFVERRHEHISVDFVYQALPARMRRAVLVAGYLVTAVFLAILVWQTWQDAVKSFRIDEMRMGAVYVTIWPAKFALPVGFAAMALMVLVHAYRAATEPGFELKPAASETIGTSEGEGHG